MIFEVQIVSDEQNSTVTEIDSYLQWHLRRTVKLLDISTKSKQSVVLFKIT